MVTAQHWPLCSNAQTAQCLMVLRLLLFTLEWHLQSQEISQWSLPLGLSFLMGAPFESLQETSLENLTRKTVYLTVLASERYCSEEHSFSGLLP